MTKDKSLILPTELDVYKKLSLREIEAYTEKIRSQPSSTRDAKAYRLVRQALSDRQRALKRYVMDFEQTNNHHLLFYDSTAGFVKMAGHSVLFFASNIANRLHWRFTIKTDSDHYYPSEDGIISFRSFERLVSMLSDIEILADQELSRTDLHFFKLSQVYSDEQINKLRDRLEQKTARITALVMPSSPVPILFDAISKASYLIFYRFKHLSDPFARIAIGVPTVEKSHQLFKEYLAFANAQQPHNLSHLVRIVELCRELRFSIAYANQLNILHRHDVYQILTELTTSERIATQHYRKLKTYQSKPTSN